MNQKFQAGFAEIDWTPPPGLGLRGQMHERLATHTRDPLCACAAAFQTEETVVVIVALDVSGTDTEFTEDVQARWAARTGFAPTSLLVHCTHTHVAPAACDYEGVPAAPGMTEKLRAAVVDAAVLALANLEPVELYCASGELEHMGWNRRVMFATGLSEMYGNSRREDFIGVEGPRDGYLPVLWAKNAEGKVTGILTGFATHPNTLESECFYSADIPGAVRKYLRQAFGEDIGVVYLTGNAGNTAPSQLDPANPMGSWRNDAGCERSGLYLAGEAARLIAAAHGPMASGVLRHERTTLHLPIRPFPEPTEPAYPNLGGWAEAQAYYDRGRETWPQRVSGQSPFPVAISVVRIGDVAICTNPAELFVEFGLQIRAFSPAAVTFCAELTDGYCGYVPTPKAFGRGGYETWCAPSSQLCTSAGDEIVGATHQLLNAAFDDKV